ncbi:hypothetical protein JX265_013875 [Neoarthrinium moseri]|uniref:Uncharacterized protein n=1 Tax=Neoarthrinium moseri TaxID=1658444 RepID=A0A9P9W7R2_9PEZI|nr:hypothetical protein JX265_013875 [Neoarthrinium moseri]
MHTREQKVKARRSGKSLLGKAKILGKKANVFSMAMYWDPVHKKMRTKSVSEVTIDEDALCQTLEVQAEQPDDLWCYRDGRSAVVHQKGALRQGNLQIKQSCVVPKPDGVKKSSARERSWRMASLTGTNLSPGVPVKRRLPMQKQIMIRRVLHLLDSLGRKPRHGMAGTRDTNDSDLVYYSRPQTEVWG